MKNSITAFTVAAAVMGVALLALDRAAVTLAGPLLGAGSARLALAELLVAGPAGLGVYGALCWLMGVKEMRDFGAKVGAEPWSCTKQYLDLGQKHLREADEVTAWLTKTKLQPPPATAKP